jgi:hypothetical protein
MPAARPTMLPGRLYDDQGGCEHLQKVRTLRGFYRKLSSVVKPDYPSFSILSTKVINKIYLKEIIQNNYNNGLMVLKLTIH